MDLLSLLLAFGVLIGPLALAKWLLDRSDRRSRHKAGGADPAPARSPDAMPRSAMHRRRLP